jgi:hypothetical protein
MTFWYRRDEIASRTGIIFAMTAVAGSMNGLIAYGISKNLVNVHGWGSWRWLFLIEGMLIKSNLCYSTDYLKVS